MELPARAGSSLLRSGAPTRIRLEDEGSFGGVVSSDKSALRQALAEFDRGSLTERVNAGEATRAEALERFSPVPPLGG